MEENREKNNKKIEDEKRLEQDFRQDRKKSSRDQKRKRTKRTGNVSFRSQQRHVSV